jgi:dolichyl-phosphate-mannose-protein mannosyltransferase
MSGPQDVGIRQRGRAGPSNRSPQPLSPTSDVDDDHLAAQRTVSDTYPSCSELYSDKLCSERLQRDREPYSIEKLLETPEASIALVGVLTLLAFALRFYKINPPDQVV